jgi:hypothetical protein
MDGPARSPATTHDAVEWVAVAVVSLNRDADTPKARCRSEARLSAPWHGLTLRERISAAQRSLLRRRELERGNHRHAAVLSEPFRGGNDCGLY